MRVNAIGITSSIEKSERLRFVSHLFQEGCVYFPKKETDILVRQLIGFGSEKHDDLVDALVMSLEYALKKKLGKGFATIYSDGSTKFFFNTSQMTIEQKKDYYRRLKEREDRGDFLWYL